VYSTGDIINAQSLINNLTQTKHKVSGASPKYTLMAEPFLTDYLKFLQFKLHSYYDPFLSLSFSSPLMDLIQSNLSNYSSSDMTLRCMIFSLIETHVIHCKLMATQSRYAEMAIFIHNMIGIVNKHQHLLILSPRYYAIIAETHILIAKVSLTFCNMNMLDVV